MVQNSGNLPADLRGAGRLTIEAITGITDIVESMHHTISSLAGLLCAKDQDRTTCITGMVYRNIRSITELVGDGLDALLGRLSSVIREKESSPGREAVLAALNGVLGDHLVARNNPLAISMQFRSQGKPLSRQALLETIRQSDGRLAIMVHGSCMNDLQFNRKGHDHGAALARDLGLIPLYVHYNTGLHISENGRQFSDLLETLLKTIAEEKPEARNGRARQPIKLFIIAHSMGGLVARSAYHYGKISGYSWPNHLQKIVFLSTPHHGAPLEKGGNWIDMLLNISPYSAPFSRLGKIRSSGITDMRYGNVIDEDWKGHDRFEFSKDQRTPVPLPEGVQCYTAAATTARQSNPLGDGLIGDGLVTLRSALGRHKKDEFNLLFPEAHQWVGREMNHMELLNHPDVYENIKKWVSE